MTDGFRLIRGSEESERSGDAKDGDCTYDILLCIALALNQRNNHQPNMPAVDVPIRSSTPSPKTSPKPIILHLGDPIEYNHELHKRLDDQFHIIRPSASDLQRPNFLTHLKKKTWGEFVAIMRPFWNTGNEMKPWDKELIELLPKGVKVYASAGAGYDWVDTESLAEHGTHPFPFFVRLSRLDLAVPSCDE